MKKILIIAVLGIMFAAQILATEPVVKENSIIVNGKELVINDENSVLPVNMKEFQDATFIYTCPINKADGDWASIGQAKKGNYILSYSNITLQIKGSTVTPVDKKEVATALKATNDWASYSEPLQKYKYIFAYTPENKLYLVVYGKV